MDIEKIATSVVTLYFSEMDNISPFISEGDNEPSWDGNIYIYKSTKGKKQNYKKEDIICRIPVQVKGDTSKGTIKGHSISYPVEIADLKNYKSHGVAYFVVRIDDDGTRTIYYDLLYPVDIVRLLNADNKKSINLEFNNISLTRDIYTSLINFDNDRNKQTSFVSMPKFEPISIDQVISTGVTFEAKMTGENTSVLDFVRYATSNPVYLYSKPAIENCPPIPVDKAMLRFESEHQGTVSVCDRVFFDRYTLLFDEKGMLFSFGYGIKQLIGYDSGSSHFSYILKGKISQIIETLQLIIEVGEKGTLKINSLNVEIPPFNDDVLEGNKQLLNELFDLQKVAKYLCIENDLIIDFEQRDNYTRQLIRALTTVIIKKEKYKADDWNDAQKVAGKLFNIYLPLLFYQDADTTTVSNLLLNNNIGCIRLVGDSTNTNLPSSFVFEKYDFERISPQYYEKIYDDLTGYSGNTTIVDKVNVITLNMLLAYDSTKSRELLGLCKRMTEWLLLEESLPYDIRLANKFQTIRRERELEASEKKIIKQQIRKTTDNNMLAALYLLIDSKPKAREHYNKLSAKDKKIFRSFPIHTLMKKNF